MSGELDLPVPRQWPSCIRSAFVHAISLASAVFTSSCALASKRKATVTRMKAELAQAYQEIALLQEEMSIKDERMQRIVPHRRPHYSPVQRLRILKLKAVRKWSIAQAAHAFHLAELTLISWSRRLDEEGENALLQVAEPVNKFPDFVRAMVQELKSLFPGLGKMKIAQVLARAGLHLGVTTVGRMLKEAPTNAPMDLTPVAEDTVDKPRVTARHPGHVGHLDLTAVPTSAGFWFSWLPFALPQRWPFCWWLAVVIDHFSRKVVGFAVFPSKPASVEVQRLLGKAFRKAGQGLRHLITDRDAIFNCHEFKAWCKRKKIRLRFGAVGKHGSICIVERFIRTMKVEGLRRPPRPLLSRALHLDLAVYIDWYNQHRPHSGLEGRTPHEVYAGQSPANRSARYEPRSRYPRASPCAVPQARVKGARGSALALLVGFFEGRKHLPVVELRRVG